jgi:hypothetical protein
MHKFVLVEKLIEDVGNLNRLQRIYESFNHIISVKEDKLDRVIESCKKYEILCEILDDMKFIYENPLANAFKNKLEEN